MIKTRIYIKEIYAPFKPTVIETFLCSCESVRLHACERKVDGTNHLPLPGKADLKTFVGTARYVINTAEMPINTIMIMGR